MIAVPGAIKIGYVVGADSSDAVERKLAALRTRVDNTIGLELISVNVVMNIPGEWTPSHSALAQGGYVEAFKEAERRGCQAVVPDGMLDLGVEAGRSEVKIPVVAPFQSALHVAACIGSRIGIIQYTAGYIPQLWDAVRRYSMSDSVVNIRPLGIGMTQLHDDPGEVRKRTVSLSRKLLDEDGADVILPTGPVLCPVVVDPDWLRTEIGAPVVEGMGAPLQIAATLVRLGVTQSNIRWPAPVR